VDQRRKEVSAVTKPAVTVWIYAAGYTFRATRGSGEIVVHKGDMTHSHINLHAVDRVAFGDWHDEAQVSTRAGQWLADHDIATVARRTRA
jgi:hypothetical protein